MTRADTSVRYRKMTTARSVLLALADILMHGLVERDDLPGFSARRRNRCDECGLDVQVGDLAQRASRPGLQPVLYVHLVCPVGDVLFRKIRWLTRWQGADIVSAWVEATHNQRCGECERPVQPGQQIALVRRPGPMVRGEKHSDWKCERCVRV